ncbi:MULTISPECIES: hypothetical protein [unclassified Halomonas]|uniref:hypothetical protein n=1 Tax=unclassified Halomonas TaxID=2609666 RepID=UPI0020A15580|nr:MULTISPECIES: hypothetical protein [unclassified Halomonas]MCP1314059.1 hypothetical protein [Halomonas sp. 707D7]MCP1325924.1 hypothetical protein [Halomonas sp. 707D4]
MKHLLTLALIGVMLASAGCASGPSSSRSAECRKQAEEMGDTMHYGDCLRGARTQSGF